MEAPSRISMTPTVARQTPKNEFGNVLKNTLETAVSMGGSLMSAMPGGGIISAAVSNVSALANAGQTGRSAAAATGITSVRHQRHQPDARDLAQRRARRDGRNDQPDAGRGRPLDAGSDADAAGEP